MKGMPLPFEFQGKGVVDFAVSVSDSSPSPIIVQKWSLRENCYVGTDKNSVSDSTPPPPPQPRTRKRSISPPFTATTSSSTLSSSLASGGCSGGAAISTTQGKCGNNTGMENDDWENVLSDFGATSPGRDHHHHQNMLPFMMMGDIDDPTMGISKLLQGTGAATAPEFDFGGGFGPLCPQGDDDLNSIGGSSSVFALGNNCGTGTNMMFTPIGNEHFPIPRQFHHHHHRHHEQLEHIESMDEKPQIYNPQMIINQLYEAQATQNPAMYLQPSFSHQQDHQQHLLLPPNPKRLNTGVMDDPNIHRIPKAPFYDSDQEMFSMQNHQGFLRPDLLEHHSTHQRPDTIAAMRPVNPKVSGGGGEEMALHQQAIIEHIFKAVELVEMGNPVLAQGILARLNQHQLSPIAKPFHRVAFYFKESLNSLLQMMNNGYNGGNSISTASSNCSPFSLIFKIGAYKSLSEISPIVQFANFTSNQAILEAVEGFDRIHIVDFDIGYGGQWASLMQELALKNGGPPSLKITAFASPSTHDELELGLASENLNHFASEIGMPFKLEILNLQLLNSMQLHVSGNEAIAVNLPIGAFSNHPSSLPTVLRFVNQLSPKIVVSLDTGCDRSDLPFAHHVIQALQSYTTLLESIDAANANLDDVQKIERFLIHPGIEKVVLNRHRAPEKTPPWKRMFLSCGFSPLQFSNFSESQADCLVQRTPIRGFHVEKRQSSLLLCWQQKDLVSVSAWRC